MYFFASRVDAIDPALRRSGRFDAEVEVTTPNEEERFQILKVRLNSIAFLCYIGLLGSFAYFHLSDTLNV